jgi:D-sedoheptulose 7-phosphate isomerase
MDHLQNLITRYPSLAVCRSSIADAFAALESTFAAGGKLLAAGNGGSAADSEHIVGELVKRFVTPRPVTAEFAARLAAVTAAAGFPPDTATYLAKNLEQGLPAINLAAHTALVTASMNDTAADIVFSQGVSSYGKPGDDFLGITTSGNSANILYAFLTAKARGLKTILLTGGTGGKAAKIADCAIVVPERETYKVQELHLPVYHCLCLMLEDRFFS